MRLHVLSTIVVLALLLSPEVRSQEQQDYQYDYEQDNLYHDYAMRQQEKEAGKGLDAVKLLDYHLNSGGGGLGLGKMVLGGGVGWLIGGCFHTRQLKRKLDAKHKKDQKALYTQYYNDVYTLQQQNVEMAAALEKLGARVRQTKNNEKERNKQRSKTTSTHNHTNIIDSLRQTKNNEKERNKQRSKTTSTHNHTNTIDSLRQTKNNEKERNKQRSKTTSTHNHTNIIDSLCWEEGKLSQSFQFFCRCLQKCKRSEN